MGIKKEILLRVRIAFLGMAVFAVLILAKLFHIQFIDNERWESKSQRQNIRLLEVKATRGNIYSDNGSLMATSLPFYRVAFDPSISKTGEKEDAFVEGIDSLCMLLSRFYGDRPEQGYMRLINDARVKNRRYVLLNSKMINHHEKKIMSTWPIFREGKMKGGVIFERVDKRFIPFGQLARRTIGYIKAEAKDGTKGHFGAGLEFSFDSVLAGQKGQALFTKVSGGRWRQVPDSKEVKPKHGYDIETTIDINLQDVTEAALLKTLKYHRADKGCVVVMEVATGEIKAIANLECINKDVMLTEEPRYAESYNYALGTAVEPGSTFKLASFIALLEENQNLKLSDTIDTGNGKFRIYERTMTDSKDGGLGKITVQEVFEKSSNIGTAKLVLETFGQTAAMQQRFVDYITDMHLGEPIHFQMKGEAIPKVKSPSDKSWSGITLPWMSIGYEVENSPLQTLMLYNAIANNGKMVKPMIVKRVRYADKVINEFEPEVLVKSICSESTLAKLHTMLEGVVERGTARNIYNANYKIAGKTGTAQKLIEGHYDKVYYASFTGYFPAENPKYSIIVGVDYPKSGMYYGNQVAGPVFKEISDKVFARDLDLHRPVLKHKVVAEKGTYPVIQAGYYDDLLLVVHDVLKINTWGNDNHKNQFVQAVKNDEMKIIQWRDRVFKNGLVPNVNGMTLKDALYVLENAGLKVLYEGKGRVQAQSQVPGQKLMVGSRIKLTLG